eukprot:jgi/Galph1/5382/GphlegSOOS_G4059.1
MVHHSSILLFSARMARVSRNLPPKQILGGKLSKEISNPSESCVTEIRFAKKVKHRILPWNFLPGDTVEILNGPEKGKRSRVLLTLPECNDLIIEDINVRSLLRRKEGSNETEEVKTEHPIKGSRVSLVCPETGQPTTVVYRYLEDGTQVRVAKVSGAIIPYPQLATTSQEEKGDKVDEMKVDNAYLCTPPDMAHIKTIKPTGLATILQVEEFTS